MSLNNTTDWKEWYLSRASQAPSARRRHLIWNEIRPGCSKKQLAVIAKGVLDIEDPTKVDWCSVRATHMYLALDRTNTKAIMSGMSNLTRFVSKGMIRRSCNWFRLFVGWSKVRHLNKVLEVIDQEKFASIIVEIMKNQPQEHALALSAIFHLAYYTGLRSSQLGHLRASSVFNVDGKVLIFASGRLIELPPHVLVPLKAYLRVKKATRAKDPALFKPEVKLALAKYPTITDTYISLARMRG